MEKQEKDPFFASGFETLEQSASADIVLDYNVHSYRIKFHESQFEFQALNENGQTRIRSYMQRIDRNTLGSTLILEKFDPYVRLEIDSNGENLFMNGNRVSLSELNDPRITSAVHEYHVFYGDLDRHIVKALSQPETARIDEGSQRAAVRRAVGVIKDVSCFLAGVPSPISVYTFLVFAPTCIGMIVADAAME